MKIGKEYAPDKVFLRHWHRIVPDTAAAKKMLDQELHLMARECIDKAHELKFTLEKDGKKSEIYDAICNIIKERTTNFI